MGAHSHSSCKSMNEQASRDLISVGVTDLGTEYLFARARRGDIDHRVEKRILI